MKYLLLSCCIVFSFMSCKNNNSAETTGVRLVTLDPGHFHAALVQKSMYEGVDSNVYVYAPGGNDVKLHLEKINSYNTRPESPTRWNEEVYTGPDFFEKMIEEKKGNVVVLSGNNQRKTDYILQSLQNGLHVFADKPMAIDRKGFDKLKEAFIIAEKNKRLLYDIMTERYEITTLLQREISMIPEIFGELEKGTPENPAITKESVHHFYKYVSGAVLTRPAWFMDVSQQGEGIVDVMTHLVDLVQWECFPEQAIDYEKDIAISNSKRWPTFMSRSEFNTITKQDDFPDYLHKNLISDSLLPVYCNGEINYTLKGIHAKTSVVWNYKAPEGAGDTHYSIMRGTKANLLIRQGKEENYEPTLLIEIVGTAQETDIQDAFKKIQTKFPGVDLMKVKSGWKIIIPDNYKEGHEAHFARVTEKFLSYLNNHNMPAWEVPNMLAKYYLTTKALEVAITTK